MSAPRDPADNVVIPRTFQCPDCGTLFHCNRAEPFCIYDHPGQYHLQTIDWGDPPCTFCESWRPVYVKYVVNEEGAEDEIVILYPPRGVLNDA